MSRVIPLHSYQSPNGNGLCTYETEGMVCGNAEKYVVHVRTGCGVEAKVDDGRGVDPVRKYMDEKASAAYQTYHGATFPVDYPATTAQLVALFHDQALRLAVAKNQAYADAWREQGYMGNVARILSKAARLRALVWGDRAVETMSTEELMAEESVRDTLLDLANLCAFAAHNMAEGNRWGDRGQ